jgi:tetratricopeptide (TPR) repeat protein
MMPAVALLIALLGLPVALQGDHLGTVVFPTSCSAAAQPAIERGVALLHSFQYDEASQAFDDAVHRDASCAMCHWGKAMSLYHQLWDWPTAATLRAARREIARAQRIGAGTPRERGYIHAAAAFFSAPASATHAARIRAYSRQLAALHHRFPDDGEATAFYALSLVALACEHVDDLMNLRQAIAILDPLFHQQPKHPGAAHYLIHAADRAELAPLGLEAARAYADIAPDSSHALHMPSHIFVRLGMWEETIALNLRAASAGAHAALEHRGDYTYQIHAMDYLDYAYLQRGEESTARALLDELATVPGASNTEKSSDRTYFAGRAAVESHRWAEAAALPIPSLPASWLTDTFWARAIGAARVGDAVGARESLIKLRGSVRAQQAHQKSGSRDVPIPQIEAEAWVAFAEHHGDRAVDALRRAASREETEGGEAIVVPAREMLADLLLALERPDEALKTYQAVLVQAPNRFDALLGAARAADALGAAAQARDYYRQLLAVAATDADRSELEAARAYVAK